MFPRCVPNLKIEHAGFSVFQTVFQKGVPEDTHLFGPKTTWLFQKKGVPEDTHLFGPKTTWQNVSKLRKKEITRVET